MPTSSALPAELTIYVVGELRPAWLALLAAHSAEASAQLRMDAAAVDQVDAAGVQLLLSLANTLARRSPPSALLLDRPSEPLRQACQALGAATLLQGEAA